MKASFLKAYGVAMVGVFHSHDHLMSAIQVKLIPASSTKSVDTEMLQTGLKAQISPAVVFLEDGTPLKPEGHETELYQLTLVPENKGSEENIVWHSKKSPSSSTVQEAHGFPDLEVDDHLLYKCDTDFYSIGWKLNWSSLNKMLQRKELYAFPHTSIDLQAYTKRSGVYTFSSLKSKGPRLHIGQAERPILTNDISTVPLEISAPYGLIRHYRSQNIRFRLGDESTKMPGNIFDELKKKVAVTEPLPKSTQALVLRDSEQHRKVEECTSLLAHIESCKAESAQPIELNMYFGKNISP